MRGVWVVVFVTCGSVEEGERVARYVLERKLAACVSVVSGVRSLFWWGGGVEVASEVLLVIKTRLDRVRELIEAIRSVHGYEVPEVIAVPVVAGFGRYLEWVDEVLGR
ncbi:MAG: divalent-cation tolerance protein CutA [Thermoprotei archaeon]|nr:MAG: divalent-cation tolerance protein CutA [Thermoprotei archaeon]